VLANERRGCQLRDVLARLEPLWEKARGEHAESAAQTDAVFVLHACQKAVALCPKQLRYADADACLQTVCGRAVRLERVEGAAGRVWAWLGAPGHLSPLKMQAPQPTPADCAAALRDTLA